MSSYIEKSIKELESNDSINLAGYQLVKVRGIQQNPTFNINKFEDIIDNFNTKDGDVFVATYVKAGTTWTQQIIHQLLRKGEPGGNYTETVPWLEAAASELLQPREMAHHTLDSINNLPAPRYFKTHATVSDLPRGKANIKVIYVARNPKDSMVSLYHHAKSKPEFGYTGDIQTFFNIFLSNKAENASWFNHVIDWYNKCKAEPSTHLFLQYEEMYQNPSKAVKTIANFLNIDVNDEIIAKVVKNSSISEMRSSSNMAGLNHFRQGGYGNWRNVFTVGMNELFDDVYAYKMKDTDLKFNFGPNAAGVDVFM